MSPRITCSQRCGTLPTAPSPLHTLRSHFPDSSKALSIPKSTDILDHINSLSGAEHDAAHAKISDIERAAMKLQKPQPGLQELMRYLSSRGVRKAICTRNFDEPVAHLLTTFVPEHAFAPVVTRAFSPPKPDPAGILHIATSWGVEEEERAGAMVMVGDSVDDMAAGARAGATTVLLVNEVNEHLVGDAQTHITISRYVFGEAASGMSSCAD